jgi:hypothetical protein
MRLARDVWQVNFLADIDKEVFSTTEIYEFVGQVEVDVGTKSAARVKCSKCGWKWTTKSRAAHYVPAARKVFAPGERDFEWRLGSNQQPSVNKLIGSSDPGFFVPVLRWGSAVTRCSEKVVHQLFTHMSAKRWDITGSTHIP